MRTFIYPSKDASITAVSASFNFGLDEILEVGKIGLGLKPTRALIQFDLVPLSASISTGQTSPSASFFLNLEVAEASALSQNQQVLVYPVSQSWLEGTGNYLQQSSNPQDGVSWNFRSAPQLNLNWSGSTYLTTLSSSVTITGTPDSLRFDITPIVAAWISGTIPNYGVVVKLADADEQNQSGTPLIQFFSAQTSTVYKPTLETAWDSQIYSTGSLQSANTDSLSIGLKNLRSEYSLNSKSLIRLSVRDRFPVRTFGNVFSRYAGNQYLPSSSYYSIVDAQNNNVIVPFDNFSKISCDNTGNFFILSTNGLYYNRPYKVMVKVVGTSTTDIIDTGLLFTVRS